MNLENLNQLYESTFGKTIFKPREDFENNPIFQEIYTNCHTKGMNQIITVTGLPRTGKSELCIYSAWALDRDKEGNHLFDPHKQIVKTLEELVEFIDTNNRPGITCVWEEAGISGKGAAARKWQQEENILLNDVFQIMGLKQQIIFVNLPFTFFLDKGARSLSHWTVETKGIDKKADRCNALFRKVAVTRKKNEIIGVRPRFFRDGRYTISRSVSTPRAPLHIRKVYYELQKSYKPQWISEVKNKIKVLTAEKVEKIEKRKITNEEYLKKIRANRKTFWNSKKNKPDIDLISIKLDIGKDKARSLAKVLAVEESRSEI